MKERQAIYVVQLEIESTSTGKLEAGLLIMNQHQYIHTYISSTISHHLSQLSFLVSVSLKPFSSIM